MSGPPRRDRQPGSTAKSAVVRCRNGVFRRVPILQRSFRWLASHGLIGRRVWSKVQPVGLQWVPCPGGNGFLYDAAAGDVLARSFIWTGFRDWESTTVPLFCELARRSTSFLDVGAFTGVYSLLACAVNPSIRAVVVEPNPSVLPSLRRNIDVNRFGERCTPIACALSDVPGTAILTIPLDTPAATLGDSVTGDRVEVERHAGDGVLKGAAVDLVKIDAENHELEVLRGLKGTLEEIGPAVFVECLSDDAFLEVRSFLERLGYSRFTYLGPDGPQDLDEHPRVVPGFPNYLCRRDRT
jgi:FkbM family methyltransferase